jgi:hypothetical protein
MNRRSRRIRPALDELDKKTLPSAGPLAHLAGGSTGAVEVRANKFYWSINVRASNSAVKNVEWKLISDNREIAHDTIPLLGSGYHRIAPGEPSPNSLDGLFKFSYKIGNVVHRGESPGTSWNRISEPPPIPTYYTLPTPP